MLEGILGLLIILFVIVIPSVMWLFGHGRLGRNGRGPTRDELVQSARQWPWRS
jgi:hypothetical protein